MTSEAGSISSGLLMCGGGVRRILLLRRTMEEKSLMTQ